MTGSGSYNKTLLIDALRKIGIREGDIVFSHVGMGFLGYPEEGQTQDAAAKVTTDAYREVLGTEGTLIVPTYTYSFCRGEDYNPETSPSTIGYYTEYFRKLPGVTRSREPIFSVAGFGPRIPELFKSLPTECFGVDSVYDRLLKADAAICNIGVGFRYATYIHFVEQSIGVPYRFMKTFTGNIVDGDAKTPASFDYYVRTAVDDNDSMPDLSRLEEDVRQRGMLAEALVGKGVVTRIRCRDVYDVARERVAENPWYLARGFFTHPLEG